MRRGPCEVEERACGRRQARRVNDTVEVRNMTFAETQTNGVVAEAIYQGHVLAARYWREKTLLAGPVGERVVAGCAVMQGLGNSGTEALVEPRVEDRDCTRTVSQEANGQCSIHTESTGHNSGPAYRCARAGRSDIGF
jgi:hypothetical protein